MSGSDEAGTTDELDEDVLPFAGTETPCLGLPPGAYGVLFVVTAILRLLTAGHFKTTDEILWLDRSSGYFDAWVNLDAGAATASTGEPATLPGVTTMIVGSVARFVWEALRVIGVLRLHEDDVYTNTVSGLRIAQMSMAIVTAVLVVAVVLLVDRWAGPRPAIVAGVLLATEPWLIGHSTVLHTDALVALFGVGGLIALAYTLGIPDPARRPERAMLMAAVSGVLLICSPLTKLSGLPFGAPAVGLLVWAAVRAHRSPGSPYDPATVGRIALSCTAAALAIVVVTWPALWADPATQIDVIGAALDLRSTGHPQFFLGEITMTPGPWFYPVALAWRATPWFLVLTLCAIPLVAIRPTFWKHGVVLAVCLTPVAATLTTAAKQFDRYGMPLMVGIAVMIGLAVAPFLPDNEGQRRTVVLVGGACAAVAALMVVPWGIGYFNPMLGGGRTAIDNLLVGWSEGSEVAVEHIEELVHGECDDVTQWGLWSFADRRKPCSTAASDPRSATFVVQYTNDWQRMTGEQRAQQVQGRELVDVVEIRDVRYALIWR